MPALDDAIEPASNFPERGRVAGQPQINWPRQTSKILNSLLRIDNKLKPHIKSKLHEKNARNTSAGLHFQPVFIRSRR